MENFHREFDTSPQKLLRKSLPNWGLIDAIDITLPSEAIYADMEEASQSINNS